MHTIKFKVILLFLCLSFSTFAQNQELGKINFPTSGSEQAQQLFIKGVLLLHSFEYEDAAEFFIEAQELEPDFAMAYWGEAMTYNHPLWDQQDQEKAMEALNRLASSPEDRHKKAKTKKEQQWLKAVEILYGEGTKKERDLAYSEYLGKLHNTYPKDHEITAFYALSILGTSHNGRDEYKYIRAGAAVEEVYAANPKHPGALHYLIHSYDDPIHAPLGLRAARLYANVAPAAAHALHMPSHIFIALGMWDRVVASNEASSQAADARRAKKSLSVDARGFHSLHWLEYGYLQQGRFGDARKLLEDMIKDYEESTKKRSAFHMAVMRGSYLIETGDWNSKFAQMDIDHKRLVKKAQAYDLFISAMVALKTDSGNFSDILSSLEAMAPLEIHHDLMNSSEMLSCCSPNYSDEKELSEGTKHAIHVMTMELKAVKLFMDDKKEEAIDLVRHASEMEGKMDFMFGPPIIAKPSFELLGDFLLETGQYEEAVTAYKTALQRGPGRTLSLLGLKEAAQRIEDQELVEKVSTQLGENLKQSDKGIGYRY